MPTPLDRLRYHVTEAIARGEATPIMEQPDHLRPSLIDDGTFDTVITCGRCGHESRFNFDPEPYGDAGEDEGIISCRYDDFIEECMAEVEADCAYCAFGNGLS